MQVELTPEHFCKLIESCDANNLKLSQFLKNFFV